MYHLPSYNKDLIQEFSEFLSEFTLIYDQLFCGDFNIHIFCPSGQFATDFKRLCFDLIHSVDGPTHHLGHTLDLIISKPSISIRKISEAVISDHLPVLPCLVNAVSSPSQQLENSLLLLWAHNFSVVWCTPYAQTTFCPHFTPLATGFWTLSPLFIVNRLGKWPLGKWLYLHPQATPPSGRMKIEEGKTTCIPGNTKRQPCWQSKGCERGKM